MKEKNEDPSHKLRYYKCTKCHGNVNQCGYTITIPHDKASLKDYTATLGHKLNHHFIPNSEYRSVFDSPRFGLVRGFHTKRDIKKDEELFNDYNYKTEAGPDWFKEMYEELYGVKVP